MNPKSSEKKTRKQHKNRGYNHIKSTESMKNLLTWVKLLCIITISFDEKHGNTLPDLVICPKNGI